MRPAPSAFLRHSVLLGLAVGVGEVALRVSPIQGLSPEAVVHLVGISAALGVGLSFGVALPLTRVSFRPWGVHLGVLLGFYGAINYRFEYVLNEFVKDPKVWAGVPGVFFIGLLLGLPFDGLLARLERPLSRAFGVLALVFAGAAHLRARPAEGAPGSRPSVVIVSLDTTRMDHLSAYGHTIHTPNIDRLAREGTVFTQAIAAAPITEPSHLAMLTGIDPFRSGVVSNGTDLGDRPALVWRALHDQGWLTAGFVAGFPLHGKYGWGQGMDVFDDDFGGIAGVQTLSVVKAWNQVAIKEHALRERTADAVLARAAPWLEKNRDDQLFAFLHFYDVHGPYDAPTNSELGPPPTNGTPLTLPGYWPESDKRITDPVWLEKAYDKEIELVDVELGRVMDALGPRLDNTVFIVTADHGESLTEHGYLFDHGDDLYDPSLRVPLLIRYPKGVKAGQRIDCQVGGVDVAATVLDLVGVDDNLPRDGRSRKAWLEGQPCDENAPVVSSTTYGRFVAVPPVAHSLRKPDEKVIVYDDKPVELFDLTADAGETQNLAPSGRSRDAEAAFRALLSTGGAVQGATMDAATCEALKGLGYIEGDAPCGPTGATP